MPQPNILWICTDQQRFDTLGCYGNPFVHTPNLDRLAQDGVLFEHAYSQSPVCTPSRASFLTGRYPRTTRCRQNGQAIPADEVLVTKMLRDAGYTCGLSGKLHLSPCQPPACPVTERRIDDGYSFFHWSHHPASIPPDHPAKPITANWPANEYNLWLREKGVNHKPTPFEGCKEVLVGPPAEHHQTTWCAQKAITFFEANLPFNRPWLFSFNCFDPHHSFDPPEACLRRYLDRLDDIPLPNYVAGELDSKPSFQRIDHQGAYGGGGAFCFDRMSDRDHRLVRAAYWAMCDLIDDQVGRMIAALRRTGQLENTLIIFTSDHGEMLGDHGIYLKGPFYYEPAVHVPLIVSWPGHIVGGRRSQALVELTDLAQTILDAIGLPHHPGMQGRSLWPLLTGAAELNQHRDDVYCEYYNAMPWHKNPTAQTTMVRTRRHKIAVCHGQPVSELYDLENDPNETRNLWNDPGYSGVKIEMLQRLCDRMAWTVDPLPPRESSF